MTHRHTIEIDGRRIGYQQSPYIVAEMSANHNGSLERAIETIEMAKQMGADAVKLQTYTPDSLTIKSDMPDFQLKGGLWDGYDLYSLYEWAQTPYEWHKPLFDHARKTGITCFSTPFDETAISPGALISTGTDAFKADADGWYDILFDLPQPSGNSFDAGESLVYTITGTGLVASSFNFFSTPDLVDPNGPFLGAAKFGSTGDGEQSDWVGAVPIPAAVWLFGTGLLGLVGVARRRSGQ